MLVSSHSVEPGAPVFQDEEYYVYLPLVNRQDPLISEKRGVAAYPDLLTSCDDANRLNASWYYNWTVFIDCNPLVGAEFVPRIWGPNNVSQLPQAIEAAKASGWLIGFNEPNLTWQAGISPQEGAILWRQIEEAARPHGIKLVSPATNPDNPGHHPGDPYGYTWLREMIEAYRFQYLENPQFDAIGLHVYSPDPNVIKSYLTDRYNELRPDYPNAKVWVLEINGCYNVSANASAVMQEIIPWLEAQDWVERYAWYGTRIIGTTEFIDCALLTPNGDLTSVGQLYLDMAQP